MAGRALTGASARRTFMVPVPYIKPNPAGPRIPRGVHPAPWRLALALRAAVAVLPYASAEARLLDGLARYVRLECTAPASGRPLTPARPADRWADVLAAVAAVGGLVGPAARRVLAEWLAPGGQVGTAPGAGAGFVPGVPSDYEAVDGGAGQG